MKHVWTKVSNGGRATTETYRMQVPGGWLYRFTRWTHGEGRADTMTFVPDGV